MLLRELIGGDPPHTCTLVFIDDPTGFGHRVVDGDRLVEHVLTREAEFARAVAEKTAEGFVETERSLTRRVFATADRFWIIWLDGDTVGSQAGGIRAGWRESSGQVKVKEFRDRDRAVAAYHRAIADKRAESYREMYGRPVTIADAPTAPKKSGKKKSR
jgi:predicted DNA-binding WGR domain protein